MRMKSTKIRWSAVALAAGLGFSAGKAEAVPLYLFAPADGASRGAARAPAMFGLLVGFGPAFDAPQQISMGRDDTSPFVSIFMTYGAHNPPPFHVAGQSGFTYGRCGSCYGQSPRRAVLGRPPTWTLPRTGRR